MNDQKIFDGPFDFALYFEENPDMLAAIPWGSHVIKSVKSIDKGCNCKRKARVVWLFFLLLEKFPTTTTTLLDLYPEYGSWRDYKKLYESRKIRSIEKKVIAK